MVVTTTAPTLDSLTLNLTQEIHVRASLEATFDALLEQMGPANQTPDGTPLPNHHRGQLSVYFRQVGALVPSIYGPSADENPFAATQASAISA